MFPEILNLTLFKRQIFHWCSHREVKKSWLDYFSEVSLKFKGFFRIIRRGLQPTMRWFWSLLHLPGLVRVVQLMHERCGLPTLCWGSARRPVQPSSNPRHPYYPSRSHREDRCRSHLNKLEHSPLQKRKKIGSSPCLVTDSVLLC